MPRPAPKPRRNKLLPFYVVLGVAALAGAFFLFRKAQGGGSAAATELQPVVMTPEQLQRVPGISKGQPNAPVVIMEFADFQCPACGQFARFSEPLVKDHIDAGRVRFVWYDYPLVEIHDNAMLASRAGRCANEQNQFWAYHDYVFGQQGAWSEQNNPVNLFIEYAEQVGLDRNAFAQCLRSDKYQKEVSESRQLGTTLGVSGTPTLFVNGKRVQETPSTRADWDALVQQETGGAAAPAPGVPAAPAATQPAGAAPAAAAPADSVGG
ncbi:DsbA family protein [Longimicrobium sp.]|uniref:DsbA family protein n=1 Tax=Longimicrobium sp. TaxID=2029185 RepID=UPI003B3ADA37